MTRCPECQAEKEKDQITCPNCGALDVSVKAVEVIEDPPESEPFQAEANDEAEANHHKHAAPFVRLSLFSAIFIAIVYVMLSVQNLGDPEGVADTFIEAVNESDPKKLQSVMKRADDEELTESQADFLLEQIGAHPGRQRELERYIRNAADHANSSRGSEPGPFSVTFEKKGERFFFFDDYHVVLHPVDMIIELDLAGREVMVGGDPVQLRNPSGTNYNLGSFYPDEYRITMYVNRTLLEDQVAHTGYNPLRPFHLTEEKIERLLAEEPEEAGMATDTVDAFFAALEAYDKPKLRTMLATPDQTVPTDQEVGFFLDVFASDASLKSQVSAYLYRQAEAFDEGSQPDQTRLQTSAYTLTFEKEGEPFYFIDGYQVMIHPEEVLIHLDDRVSDVMLDGEPMTPEWQHGTLYSLGMHLPSMYELSWVYETPFGPYEYRNHFPYTADPIAEVEFQEKAVNLSSDLADADLIVDNRYADLKISSEGTAVKPVSLDRQTEVSAEVHTPLGFIQSEPVVLDQRDLHFAFLLSRDWVNDIIDPLYGKYEELDFASEADPADSFEMISAIAVQGGHMYLSNDETDARLNVRVPYKEVWANGDPELGMTEFERLYEAVLIYDEAQRRWEVKETVSKETDPGMQWTYRYYDEERQLDAFRERQEAEQRSAYLASPVKYAEALMIPFHTRLAESLNEGDTGLLSPFLHEKAPSHSDRTWLDSLGDRDGVISVVFEETDVVSFDEGGGDNYRIITEDVFGIEKEDGEAYLVRFQTEYELILTEEGFLIRDHVSTEETGRDPR